MKLIDLVTDSETGQYSHTKLWSNIAYAVGTIAFIRLAFDGSAPDADIWLIYLGVIGGHTAVSKLVSMKYSKDTQT
jgi:hypothetical protein